MKIEFDDHDQDEQWAPPLHDDEHDDHHQQNQMEPTQIVLELWSAADDGDDDDDDDRDHQQLPDLARAMFQEKVHPGAAAATQGSHGTSSFPPLTLPVAEDEPDDNGEQIGSCGQTVLWSSEEC